MYELKTALQPSLVLFCTCQEICWIAKMLLKILVTDRIIPPSKSQKNLRKYTPTHSKGCSVNYRPLKPFLKCHSGAGGKEWPQPASNRQHAAGSHLAALILFLITKSTAQRHSSWMRIWQLRLWPPTKMTAPSSWVRGLKHVPCPGPSSTTKWRTEQWAEFMRDWNARHNFTWADNSQIFTCIMKSVEGEGPFPDMQYEHKQVIIWKAVQRLSL